MEKGADHHLERRQEAGGRRQDAIEQGEPKGWKVGGVEYICHITHFIANNKILTFLIIFC